MKKKKKKVKKKQMMKEQESSSPRKGALILTSQLRQIPGEKKLIKILSSPLKDQSLAILLHRENFSMNPLKVYLAIWRIQINSLSLTER